MKRLTLTLALSLAPLFVAGCSTCCRAADAPETTPAATSVEFVELLHTASTRVTEAGGRTIDDPVAFAALWEECASATVPRRALPRVDWSKQRVLCVASGARPSAGYGVRIEHVERRGPFDDSPDELTVFYVETAPNASASVATVVTYPVHVVAIPRFEAPVRYVTDATGRFVAR